MKRILYVIAIVAFGACCPCDFEDNLPIDFSQGKDTTYLLTTVPAAQTKNILIEDFTGVKCKNCPDAHDVVKAIELANPGRIAAVAMHINGSVLAFPHSTIAGYQDFRTVVGTNLYSTLNTGGVQGIPAGAVDRTVFPGQPGILNNTPTSWSSFVNQQLSKTTPVNISIENNYDAATRNVVITTRAIFTTIPSADTAFISIGIVESGIINPQELPTTEIDTFYEHNHVLRQMLTPDNGGQLIGSYVAGRVFQKGFTVQLPPLWNADKCKVIAFVHKSGSIKEVWHVVEKAIK